jgi:hypothetical protein
MGRPHKLIREAKACAILTASTESEAPEWQTGNGSADLGCDERRPDDFARMGMMQAINRHRSKEVTASGKTTHWGKRKLRRDQ